MMSSGQLQKQTIIMVKNDDVKCMIVK